MSVININAIKSRREWFYRETRQRIHTVVNPDGSGKIPQFAVPHREVFWVLPALYSGGSQDIELANHMVEEYGRTEAGLKYNIFQSTIAAGVLTSRHDLLSPEAARIMETHTRKLFAVYGGAAQADLKFHGCNDNMPMMATKGLILGGEFLGDEQAYRHGVWNLNEFRRLLSRSAWASEFNSSTYSAITLSNLAQIATHATDQDIQTMARECEERLWAELLLHYHPGSKTQGGPYSRAYAVDYAGHNHSTQMLFWLMFGTELTGRDLIASYFYPDENSPEVIHFKGNRMQNVAEYCEMIEPEFHLKEELAQLITKRSYPALLQGRAEGMARYFGGSGEYHTVSYMEEEFALGSVDTPMCSGEQTSQIHVVYKRKPQVDAFHDSGAIFCRYRTLNHSPDLLETAGDGICRGEQFIKNQGWLYTMQKNNTALLLAIPNLNLRPVSSSIMKMEIVFSAHYGRITASIVGNGEVQPGIFGEVAAVEPVSIETGEIYVHIQPLLPTALPRKSALRFVNHRHYQILELINYEGPERSFDGNELAFMQNGFVITVDSKRKWDSLKAFHQTMSRAFIVDYTILEHRFLRYRRPDVEFEIGYTPKYFGVQTRAINGRTSEQPTFYSNQLNTTELPFMQGPVSPDMPFFPWSNSLEMHLFPQHSWLIGANGLPDENPYSNIQTSIKEQIDPALPFRGV